MLDDQGIEHAFDDAALVVVELAQCLELEFERLIGTAFGVSKDQFVQADAERERDLLERVQRWLRCGGLVALHLREVELEGIGEVLLCPATLLAQAHELGGEVHGEPGRDGGRGHDDNDGGCEDLPKVA